MRLIIEYEGIIVDVAPAAHRAHVLAAEAVGWSHLDQPTFWRMMRKQGRDAPFLRGAKPTKFDAYRSRFDTLMESDEMLSSQSVDGGTVSQLGRVARNAKLATVTLGTNAPARRSVCTRGGLDAWLEPVHAFHPDPRGRPGALTRLGEGSRRVLVAATSDALVRAAGTAGFLAVGITTGMCSALRLQQAGADVVYHAFEELADSLTKGAPDLIRAGWPPPSYDV